MSRRDLFAVRENRVLPYRTRARYSPYPVPGFITTPLSQYRAMDPRSFLDEKIELVVSESQLMINNIRQQKDWKENFETMFENKLKTVEQLLKEKPGSQDLLEIQVDLNNEMEQLRLEAGPAKAPPPGGGA